MSRLTLAVLMAVVVVAAGVRESSAQEMVDAQWVWFDAGDPAKDAPAGKVWFRNEYRAEEPSTGVAIVACDDEFILWVNGQKVGQGGGAKSFRFSLSGIVERGINVFAVEATNKSGKAGLLVDAEIRGQSGGKIRCDTGPGWKATREAPRGEAWRKPQFDDRNWKSVKVIGPHAESPWKEITFALGDLDRFQVPDGFEIKRIADHKLVGSLVAMTWGSRGRLLVSREGGPIFNCIDTDGDGTYDQVKEFTSAVKNCQGLCMVFDDLYAVGNGPEGAGMYRLPDRNHDDEADEVVLVTRHRGGMGEHGPHDVVYGPDGWLYHNIGNHAGITSSPEPTTPCRNYEEGYLLQPKFEDAGGHAVGIKAPGGTIWRFTPDGQKWWLETNGFRNEYDIAFNSKGDLFTFDSDMEWDVNLPWYRPVRIHHCIPGSEFGWRSGAAKWPDYYYDSLPATVNVGRGSPTGVVFYEHTQFPEKYRGAMLNCDWSMGRIIVAYLKPDGATYTGTFDNLVTGNPLNVSDIEVDRDGSVVFCTGGRNTEGGLYRVVYSAGSAKTPKSPKAETLSDILNLPQTQSAWARELTAAVQTRLGDKWAPALIETVFKGSPAQKVRAMSLLAQHGPKPEAGLLIKAAGDADAGVRQFATLLLGDHPTPEVAQALGKLLLDPNPVVRRRACEAFVRSGLEPPAAPFQKLLADPDRWLRFAARIAAERISPANAAAGLQRNGRKSDPDFELTWLLAQLRADTSEQAAGPVLEKIPARFTQIKSGTRPRLDLIRLTQLALARFKSRDNAPLAKEIGPLLLTDFQKSTNAKPDSLSDAIRLESARLLVYLQVPGAAAAIIEAIEKSNNTLSKMHYGLCLRYLNQGWTSDLKRRYLDWYESTRDLEGGNSLQGYLRNIVAGALERYSPAERKELILAWKQRPHATRLILAASQPGQIQDFDQVISGLLAEVEAEPAAGGQEIAALLVDALSKSDASESQALLRRLFDENADRRDLLARSLAKHPVPENIPYLMRGIASGDKTTMQISLQAVGASDYKPAKPEEIRSIVLAGLKLGNEGGKAAVTLLQKWTGSKNPAEDNIHQSLAHYQQWFREQHPDEPAPELAREDTEKTKYTVQQVLEFLEKNPEAARGDIARGKQVFVKVNCAKCHRFLKEGEGVGPDLTTVRRRFQKKEILEAILLPSQVISDQYAAITVQTTEGLVHTGMPLPNPGSKNLLLLLSDATRLEVPADKVEEKIKARSSVMPDGLLKDLSLADIADLFAFLETSRNNPEPAAGSSGR